MYDTGSAGAFGRTGSPLMSRAPFAVLILAAIAAFAGCEKQPTAAPAAAGGAPLRIAVVPKGTTHEFWKSVHAGAIKAERELGNVKVTFRGPEREDDREQQVSLV